MSYGNTFSSPLGAAASPGARDDRLTAAERAAETAALREAEAMAALKRAEDRRVRERRCRRRRNHHRTRQRCTRLCFLL